MLRASRSSYHRRMAVAPLKVQARGLIYTADVSYHRGKAVAPLKVLSAIRYVNREVSRNIRPLRQGH